MSERMDASPSALHIDQYYCITLPHCEDRRKLLVNEWRELGLEPRYFFREKDPKDSTRGCFESHVAVCRDALAQGHETILILEDDFKFLPFSKKQRRDANRIIDSGLLNTEYEMLFLGYIPHRVHLSGYPGIAHVRGNGLQGYIVGRRGMEAIANAHYDGQPIDTWCKARLQQLALFPMVCIQQGGMLVKSEVSGGSDGVNKWPRRLRKQYIWAYLRYGHKSLWNKVRGVTSPTQQKPAVTGLGRFWQVNPIFNVIRSSSIREKQQAARAHGTRAVNDSGDFTNQKSA